MTGGGAIPAELEEASNELLSKKRIVIKKLIALEVKPEKWESKLLALSPYRLYLVGTKAPNRVDVSCSFLEIQSLTSRNAQQLLIECKDGKRLLLLLPDTKSSLDPVLWHIMVSLKNLWPQLNIQERLLKVEVMPNERLGSLHQAMNQARQKETGSCGGFTQAYTFMCDYHGLPYREDIAWDVDTIYMSQDCKELSLSDFDHMDSRDLIPVIGALQHNTWFKTFNGSGVKLNSDAQNELLKVIENNATLEELVLENSGVKGDFLGRLANTLISNKNCPLTGLNFSGNHIEDKGLSNLCGPISQLPKGLSYIRLSRTGITAKGVNRLAESLSTNPNISSTLKSLDLSENSFKGEDISNLCTFLAKSNSITSLNLAGTDCVLDQLFGALLHGCFQFLQKLDLSRNVFSQRRNRDATVPPSLRNFFSSCCALQKVSLGSCKLPPDAVKNVLLAIASNPTLVDMELDISGNDLKTAGANIIESCIMGINNIHTLDISDNGFDNDMVELLDHVKRNRSIKKLCIGKNFYGIKPKNLPSALEALVNMIQEEGSGVESLSIADSRLKTDIVEVINALGSNSSLTELDISGNLMGDVGARMLAKALQINTKLHTVYWDRNNVSTQGFQDIAFALKKNYTMKKMPIPIHDAAAVLRSSPEKTESLLQQIESLLQRNHSPQKFGSDQGYRLQQGILISSTQQLVDRLVVNIQDTISGLHKGALSEQAQSDVSQAQSLVKDADQCKQLLPSMQVVALKSEDQGNMVEKKLTEMAVDLGDTIQTHLQETMDSMIQTTEDQCPTVLDDEDLKRDIEEECCEKVVLPKYFTRTLLLEQVGADVMNKIGELHLAVAAIISDRVLDSVLESLNTSNKLLTNHLNTQISETRENNDGGGNRLTVNRDSASPHASPKPADKKKSIHNRKLRPKSVIDMNLDEGIGASPERKEPTKQPVAATRHKKKDKTASRISLPSLQPETETAPKLEHLAKSRPRRAKTRAATRATVKPPHILEETETGAEGIDEFFEKKPVPSATTSKAESLAAELKAEPVKKPEKRALLPKNITGFFKKSPTHKADLAKKKSMEDLTSPSKEETIHVKPEVRTPESPPREEPKVNDEPEELPEVVVRRPAGVPKNKPGVPGMPSMAGGLMAEMKLKRTTMIQKQSDSNEKKEEKPLPIPTLRPTSVMPQPKTDHQKKTIPLLKHSASAPVLPIPTEEKKENGTTSPKPVRPTSNRPKPPPKLPKPGLKPAAPSKPVPASRTSFGNGGRISDTQEDKSGENSGSDSPGEVKRNSVKDKIAVLDKNSNEQPSNAAIIKPKSSSLPKSTSSLDKTQERSSIQLADDAKGVEVLDQSAALKASQSAETVLKPSEGPRLVKPGINLKLSSPRSSKEDEELASSSGKSEEELDGEEVYI